MKESILEAIDKVAIRDIVILCGAGISYTAPTSLPTVQSFYSECVKNTGINKRYQANLLKKIIKANIEPRFEVILNEIRIYLDNNLNILKIYDNPSYNINHLFLSKFLSDGGTVITTNFDHCIENAASTGSFNKIVFNGKQKVNNSKEYTGTLVKPHGCILEKDRTKLIATIKALTESTSGYRYYRQWRKLILEVLKDKTIIVLGYSGSDDFDIMPILKSSKHKVCYWINFDSKAVIPNKITNDNNLNQKTRQIDNCSLYYGKYDSIYQILIKGFDAEQKISGSQLTNSFSSLLTNVFDSEEKKIALTNFILFYHKLYDDIILLNKPHLEIKRSKLLLMQNIMALYRLGNYGAIIEQINEFKYDFDSTVADLMIQHHLSPSYYYLGNEAKALEILKIFKENCEKAENMDFLLEALFLEGSIFSNKNEIDKALTAFDFAELILKGFKNFEMEGKLYWALGDLNQRQTNLVVALNYFRRANKLFLKVRNFTSLLFINLNMGGVLLDLKQYHKADLTLKKAEEGLNHFAVNAPGGSHIAIYVYFLRAQYNFKQGYFNDFCSEIDKLLRTLKYCLGHPYTSLIVLLAFLVKEENCHTQLAFKRIISNKKKIIIFLKGNRSVVEKEIEPLLDELAITNSVSDSLNNKIRTIFQKRYYY